MATIRALAAILLLLGWLPVTQGCDLGVVLAELGCCCPDSHESGADSDPTCEECVTLKSGALTSSRHHVPERISAEMPASTWSSWSLEATKVSESVCPAEPYPESPPPLCILDVHTALPVRGPSHS